ncbi:FGGY-family carbohydrate kinase [Thalassospira marina]|uniref:Carbohydrate kinase n=1 Tax=Thalassospira marina TaxID=2048283 RepID=A0ABM6QBY0_9PROT|nr:FGGY-family carbohydrate kinase [Thalassospira marina]AUG54068.1 carbohydrate kinase [Thalassospira marina]
MASFIIGLDYGTESARGVLIDATSGTITASHTHAYRHGVMTDALPDGTPLPQSWALQHAPDYTEACLAILTALGKGRDIAGIGIGFTASTPLPATQDGTPLSSILPGEKHAYVKLWKHGAAQPWADRINAGGGDFLKPFGGKLSGEWLIAKAAQIADEAPDIWAKTDKFIEAGDWLVWQLTGQECRSLGLATYKAQYDRESGQYPDHLVNGLDERLGTPHRVGTSAGRLCREWCEKTGILNQPDIAVAVIDSHVVLPAVGGVTSGCFVGALGTSAVYLYLNETARDLPPGIEGMGFDGSMRDLWCFEAGQAGFGDTLAWFVKTFPLARDRNDLTENFRLYNQLAREMAPGSNHLVALDWWNGNRVPHASSALAGVLMGLRTNSTAAGIYRALLESLCYGARSVLELFLAGNFPINRVVMTSGLAQNNPLLVQMMADILKYPIEVPEIDHATAVGAAIHGAVAAGLVDDYSQGTKRFGARTSRTIIPNTDHSAVYDRLFAQYRAMAANPALHQALQQIDDISRHNPA